MTQAQIQVLLSLTSHHRRLQENSLLFASLAGEAFSALAHTDLGVAVTTATALVGLGSSSIGFGRAGRSPIRCMGKTRNTWLATVDVAAVCVDDQQVLDTRVSIEGDFPFGVVTGRVIHNRDSLDNLVGQGFQGSFYGTSEACPVASDGGNRTSGPSSSVQVSEGDGECIAGRGGSSGEIDVLFLSLLGSSLGEHGGQRIVALQAHAAGAVRSVVASIAVATLDLIGIPSTGTR